MMLISFSIVYADKCDVCQAIQLNDVLHLFK